MCCYIFSSHIGKSTNHTNVSKRRHNHINITNPTKYLLLPIEESKDEAKVLLDTSSPADTWMDIRLAQDKIDYYVPFELGNGSRATVKILNLKHDAICYKPGILKLSNEWSTVNTDFYRPSYHHTPSFGWMNDQMECFIWTEYTIFAINIIPTVLNGVICIGDMQRVKI